MELNRKDKPLLRGHMSTPYIIVRYVGIWHEPERRHDMQPAWSTVALLCVVGPRVLREHTP